MTIEWHIPEEENRPLPTDVEEYRPPRRLPPWIWVLLLLVIVVATAIGFLGGRFWRATQNEDKLRAELTEVVIAESQAQSFGLRDEINNFAAAGADRWWRESYALLFDPQTNTVPTWATAYPASGKWHPPAVRPEITDIALNDTGTRAEISVEWRGNTIVTEHRTYVVEDGQWQRMQTVPLNTEVSAQSQSEHFVVRGSADNLAALNGGADMLIPLENVYDHMVETWPAEYIHPSTVITITIQSRELQTLLIRAIPQDITLNAVDVGLADPYLPYTPERQQLVIAATLSAIHRLDASLENLDSSEWRVDGTAQTVLFYLFPEAEAQQVVLTDEERSALRALWREQLNGNWFSPFESPNTPERVYRPGHQEAYFQWLLSSRLLLDQLYVEYGITPGALVTLMRNDPYQPYAEYVSRLTGLSIEQLDTRLREYAMVSEGAD